MQPAKSAAPAPPTQTRRVQFHCDIYRAEVHAGVIDYSRQAGWALYDGQIYVPSVPYAEPCDGILAIAGFPALVDWLSQQGVPVVRLLCSRADLPYPAVEPDPEAIGVRAARHFLTLGSPHCVFYTAWLTDETESLFRGFSETLRAAGRAVTLLNFGEGRDPALSAIYSRQERWDFLHQALAKLPRPLAVFAEDDRYAYDLIQAAAMLGWRIPEDIAVLGSDDRELILGKYPVPVSSVDTNLRRIGWEGAALLDRILNGDEPPRETIRIPPGEVVVRRSTATFVCAHPGVTTAVNLLRASFHEPLKVADIARAAGLSSRSLQTLFKEHVGCTVSEELSRLRMEHALRLLRETDLKLSSVATEAGLRNAKYLCEVFRESFGITPTEYRKAQQEERATA